MTSKQLVDSRCLKALEKAGLHRAAAALAVEAEASNAATAAVTLCFLKAEDDADADFVAELTVTVRRV